jgi:hypothetical protein
MPNEVSATKSQGCGCAIAIVVLILSLASFGTYALYCDVCQLIGW